MSETNRIVTELVVDARQAEQGSAAFIASMRKMEEARLRDLATQEKLQRAQEHAGGSVMRLASSIERLRAMSDPMYASMRRIEDATLKYDAAVRRGIVGQEEASRQLAQYRERMDSAAQSADRLRRSYDQSYANMAGYRQVEEEVSKLVASRNLTMEQGSAILAGASARFKQLGDGARSANDNVKLTANQMQGLGYQVNDIGTMLAMGSSPFQILASQAGQVAQVLQDGPNGIKGSLKAIGSSIVGFARSIPVAGYAVAGLTAGVAALWYMTKGPEARSAEESLKTFESAIKRLEGRWKDAAKAAKEHYETAVRAGDSRPAVMVDVYRDAQALQKDLKASIRDLNHNEGLSQSIIRPFSGAVSQARRDIMHLYADLQSGEESVQSFSAKLLKIRLSPEAPASARNLADEILGILPPLIEVERKTQALNNTLAALRAPKGTMARNALPNDVFENRFGPTIGGDGRFGQSAGIETIRGGLRSQRNELQGLVDAAEDARNALANIDLSPVQRQIAETTQAYDRRIEAYKQSTQDAIGLAALQQGKEAALALIAKEATKAEDLRAEGMRCELPAITTMPVKKEKKQ